MKKTVLCLSMKGVFLYIGNKSMILISSRWSSLAYRWL